MLPTQTPCEWWDDIYNTLIGIKSLKLVLGFFEPSSFSKGIAYMFSQFHYTEFMQGEDYDRELTKREFILLMKKKLVLLENTSRDRFIMDTIKHFLNFLETNESLFDMAELQDYFSNIKECEFYILIEKFNQYQDEERNFYNDYTGRNQLFHGDYLFLVEDWKTWFSVRLTMSNAIDNNDDYVDWLPFVNFFYNGVLPY